MFDKYTVTLTLDRDMLGTNSCDPNILDTHILERQRKLILEKSQINSQVNKYLEAIPISKERGEEEVNKTIEKLEEVLGYPLSDEDRQKAIRGELESLKETIQELDLKGSTVFFWNKELKRPCIGDHMVLGFLKAAAEAIGKTLPTKAGTVLNSVSYTQSLINQHVRVVERFITFDKDLQRNEDGSAYYYQRSLRAMTAKGPRVSLAKSEIVNAGAKLTFTLKVMKDSKITEEILRKLFSYGEMSGLGQWRNAGYGQFSFVLSST
jgi:hypothetical protein